jgi:hypothetical protein
VVGVTFLFCLVAKETSLKIQNLKLPQNYVPLQVEFQEVS